MLDTEAFSDHDYISMISHFLVICVFAISYMFTHIGLAQVTSLQEDHAEEINNESNAHGDYRSLQCQFEGEEPSIVQVSKSGPILYVCGEVDKNKSNEDEKYLKKFSVYYQVGTQKPHQVYENNSDKAYYVLADDFVGVVLEELVEVESKILPIYRSAIICNRKGCKKAKEICVYPLPENSFPDALVDWEQRLKQSEGLPDGSPTNEMLLNRLYAQALGGDKAALSYFKDKKNRTKLTESDRKVFDDLLKGIDRAKRSGCFEKPKEYKSKKRRKKRRSRRR